MKSVREQMKSVHRAVLIQQLRGETTGPRMVKYRRLVRPTTPMLAPAALLHSEIISLIWNEIEAQ